MTTAPETFSGLCIGGPLDGTLHTNENRRFDVRVRAAEGAEPKAGCFTYKHVTFYFVEDGWPDDLLGFWVPYAERNARRYVVKALAEFYTATGGWKVTP